VVPWPLGNGALSMYAPYAVWQGELLFFCFYHRMLASCDQFSGLILASLLPACSLFHSSCQVDITLRTEKKEWYCAKNYRGLESDNQLFLGWIKTRKVAWKKSLGTRQKKSVLT